MAALYTADTDRVCEPPLGDDSVVDQSAAMAI